MRRAFTFTIVLLWAATLTVAAQEDKWGALLDEGFQHLNSGRAAEASRIFDHVVAEARKTADVRSLAEARRGQGRVLAARGDAAGMQAAHAEALNLFESVGDWKGIGNVRMDFGFAAWQRRDFDASRAEYELAVTAFGKAGLPTNQANALRNMTFSNMSRAESIVALERALPLAREGSDRRLEGQILHTLGDLTSNTGDQQGALDYYEAALGLLEGTQDAALARLLTSFGRLHRLHGDLDQALSYHQRALDLLRKTQDRDGIRQSEDAVAGVLMALERPQEAFAYAERALTIAEESRPALAPAQRLRVGEIALRVGDTNRALELFTPEQTGAYAIVARHVGRAAALRIRGDFAAALVEADAAVAAAQGLVWDERIGAYWARSQIHETAGRLADAIADVLYAVRVLEDVRGGLVVSDRFRAAFSDGYRMFYDRAVELLARSGRHQEAFDIAESGRARALLDLRSARAAPIDRGIEEPRSSTDAVNEELVVAYWVTRESTHAWVRIAGRVVHATRIPIARKELERLVARANADQPRSGPATTMARRGQTQTAFASDPRPTLRLLHDRLLDPVRPALPKARGARLVIVPDGPLLGLSFAELLAANGRYAVEDYTLQYAPSVALLQPMAPRAPTGPAAALLVSLSTGYPKVIGDPLAPLPGVRREVDAVMRLFPPETTTRVIDTEATEEKIRAAMGTQSVIHLATHAVASSRSPAESFLALRPGSGHDGRLTAGEIIGMSLRADLVVLSACHGASGQVAGEGMLGLSRALLAAGARALLASVRELPDEAAADILPRFYAAWRSTGDAAGALRTAQLDQLRRLRAGRVQVTTPFGPVILPEHPSLWAGFVLIGER